MPEPKKGYLTTEFWLTVLAMALGTLLTSGIVADGSLWTRVLGAAIDLLALLGYTASRMGVKKAAAIASGMAASGKLESSADPP